MGLSICSMAWVNHEMAKNVPLILAVLFICVNIMVWWKSPSRGYVFGFIGCFIFKSSLFVKGCSDEHPFTLS